jgi:hypothetical protein
MQHNYRTQLSSSLLDFPLRQYRGTGIICLEPSPTFQVVLDRIRILPFKPGQLNNWQILGVLLQDF